jgi:hypothetical protein
MFVSLSRSFFILQKSSLEVISSILGEHHLWAQAHLDPYKRVFDLHKRAILGLVVHHQRDYHQLGHCGRVENSLPEGSLSLVSIISPVISSIISSVSIITSSVVIMVSPGCPVLSARLWTSVRNTYLSLSLSSYLSLPPS